MSILITRPSPYGEELVEKLLTIGKFAYHLPLVYFSEVKKISSIKKYLNLLNQGDYLFILSQNAATYTHTQLLNAGIYWPSKIKYFSIGYQTSLKMHQLSGIKSKYPKNEENSENLLKFPELIHDIQGRTALILKGNNGRTILENTLQKRGALTLCYECYYRKPVQYNGQEQYDRMITLNTTTIVVTTKETLQLLYYLIPKTYRNTWLIQCKLIVISLRLANFAKYLGWTNISITKSANNNNIFRILK